MRAACVRACVVRVRASVRACVRACVCLADICCYLDNCRINLISLV